MASRKDIENFIIKTMSDIDKTNKNSDMYKTLFSKMSNQEFETWMEDLKNGNGYINIIIPPLSDIEKGITVESNLKVGKKLGIKFFQKLSFEDDDVMSPIPVLVGYAMLRRVKQTSKKGLRVPKNNKIRTTLTNESSGESKGARITLPETDILLGHKLKYTMKEFLNVRGGDMGAYSAMISEITKTGKVSQNITDRFRTGTGSKRVVKSLFKAMHIDITL